MSRASATIVGLIVSTVLSAAAFAPAADISLSAAITATFSPDGTTVISSVGAVLDGHLHAYRVDISALLTGTIAPGESFGATSFDVILGTGLSRVTTNNVNIRTNWLPNNPILSIAPGIADGGTLSSYWQGGDNADLGVSNSDLIGIVQDVDGSTLGKLVDPNTLAPVADPRQAIGKGMPFKLGSVYVLFNSGGVLPGTLSFANAEYSIANTNLPGVFNPAQPTTIPRIIFLVIPEPASIRLISLGIVALIGLSRRKRIEAEREHSGFLKT